MSADGWSYCPKCNWLENEEYVIPCDSDKVKLARTVREHKEMGISSGAFYVIYHGICIADRCDFEFEYKYDKEIKVKKTMIKLTCPQKDCHSHNVNQYRMPTGKIWCVDCGFTIDQKEHDNSFEKEYEI